jgi:hypothetical protein
MLLLVLPAPAVRIGEFDAAEDSDDPPATGRERPGGLAAHTERIAALEAGLEPDRPRSTPKCVGECQRAIEPIPRPEPAPYDESRPSWVSNVPPSADDRLACDATAP